MLEDKLTHECGLAAAINIPLASEIVRNMLFVQQPRGDDGAGIVSIHDTMLHSFKESGRVEEVFPKKFDFMNRLPGKFAIGHIRYKTKGPSGRTCNLQPFHISNSKYGEFTIAVNGQLVDINDVETELIEKGTAFQSGSDSEILAHLILNSRQKTIDDAIEEQFSRIPAAYSFIVATPQKTIIGKDKFGVRPLSVASYDKGYLVASETTAFRIMKGYKFIEEISPGCVKIFHNKTDLIGMNGNQYIDPDEHFCIFEAIYFSNPRSQYKGTFHEDFRQLCGMILYEENQELFDKLKGENLAVVPILDSGKQSALGLTKRLGPEFYKEYFLRRHDAPKANGRSYTASLHKERVERAFMKLDLREEKIVGKTIITVDDSIVRGTTSKINNQRLRDAGAKQIINVVASPTISNICIMGMDHQSKKELVSHERNLSEIAESIGADQVIYLSQEGLQRAVSETYDCGFCAGCLGGEYPQEIKKYLDAHSL